MAAPRPGVAAARPGDGRTGGAARMGSPRSSWLQGPRTPRRRADPCPLPHEAGAVDGRAGASTDPRVPAMRDGVRRTAASARTSVRPPPDRPVPSLHRVDLLGQWLGVHRRSAGLPDVRADALVGAIPRTSRNPAGAARREARSPRRDGRADHPHGARDEIELLGPGETDAGHALAMGREAASVARAAGRVRPGGGSVIALRARQASTGAAVPRGGVEDTGFEWATTGPRLPPPGSGPPVGPRRAWTGSKGMAGALGRPPHRRPRCRAGPGRS